MNDDHISTPEVLVRGLKENWADQDRLRQLNTLIDLPLPWGFIARELINNSNVENGSVVETKFDAYLDHTTPLQPTLRRAELFFQAFDISSSSSSSHFKIQQRDNFTFIGGVTCVALLIGGTCLVTFGSKPK